MLREEFIYDIFPFRKRSCQIDNMFLFEFREENYLNVFGNCQNASFENDIHENPFHSNQLEISRSSTSRFVAIKTQDFIFSNKKKKNTFFYCFFLNSYRCCYLLYCTACFWTYNCWIIVNIISCSFCIIFLYRYLPQERPVFFFRIERPTSVFSPKIELFFFFLLTSIFSQYITVVLHQSVKDPSGSFTASDKWLWNFTKRYGISKQKKK